MNFSLLRLGMAWLSALVGTVLLVGALIHRRRGVPVEVEVVELGHSTAPGESDLPVSAPVFRILGGPHDGIAWQSRMTSSRLTHRIGDRIPATYDPKSGVIHSDRTRGLAWSLTLIYLAAGYGGVLWLTHG